MRETYEFGSYRLDVAARRLTTGGEPVALTLRAFDLLVALVRAADRAVPRSQLLEEVWRDVVVEEGNLDTHVSALRRALAGSPGAIETVRGFGYRFALPVVRSESGSSDPPSPSSDSPAAEPLAVPVTTVAAPRSVGREFLPWAAVMLLTLSGAAWWWLSTRGGATPPVPSPGSVVAGAGGLRTFAVLPIDNLSRSSDVAWLATALEELLGTEAGRGGGVATVPGSGVARLASELGIAGDGDPARERLERLRERLGVDLVLGGSYLAVAPDRELRIDLVLSDGATGRPLWRWSETGRVDGLLDLVATAGESLRGQLGAAGQAPGEGRPAVSAEALRLYAVGLDARRDFHPGAALEALERAVVVEPTFAAARGALADVLGELGQERRARSEARTALELAERLPDEERMRLEMRLYSLTRQWRRAIEVGQVLVARSPEAIDDALELARAHVNANQPDEASAILDRLAALPGRHGRDPRIEIERGWAARVANDFVGMRTAGERTVVAGRELGSDLVVAEGLVLVSWAELTLNRWREGLVACERGAELARSIDHRFLFSRHRGLCGWNHLNLGELDEAESDFREALEVARSDGDLDQATDFLSGLGSVAANRARPAEAEAWHVEQLAVARQAGDVEAEINALGGVASTRLEAGRLAEAEEAAREAVTLARDAVSPLRYSIPVAILASIRLNRGDVAEARRLYEESLSIRRSKGSRTAWIELALTGLELEAGDPAAALERVAETERSLAATPDDTLARAQLEALRADALARLGRTAEAERAFATFDEIGRSLVWGAGMRTELELLRAAALERLGRVDEANALWRGIADRTDLVEVPLMRLRAAWKAAGAGSDPAARAALEAEARERRFGLLLNETL